MSYQQTRSGEIFLFKKVDLQFNVFTLKKYFHSNVINISTLNFKTFSEIFHDLPFFDIKLI